MGRIMLVFIKQKECTFLLYISTVFILTHLPKARTAKTGFGQVKIKKEFVSINKTFFLNLAFGQVGKKY
jgi:hypothetical protein